MKKVLSTLALLLVVAGCSTAPETDKPQDDNKPAAITTLDAPTFASEMENTETIKVYVADYEDPTSTAVEENLKDENSETTKAVMDAIAAMNLEKADSQEKVYGTLTFFIDLNHVYDSNYTRFAVIDDVIVVQTNEGFVNYTLDDDAKEAIKTISDTLINEFQVEDEEE